MPNAAVQKQVESEKIPSPAPADIRELSDRIRERAFEIFQQSGSVDGHDLEHWLEAEQEFMASSHPASEL